MLGRAIEHPGDGHDTGLAIDREQAAGIVGQVIGGTELPASKLIHRPPRDSHLGANGRILRNEVRGRVQVSNGESGASFTSFTSMALNALVTLPPPVELVEVTLIVTEGSSSFCCRRLFVREQKLIADNDEPIVVTWYVWVSPASSSMVERVPTTTSNSFTSPELLSRMPVGASLTSLTEILKPSE